MLTSQNLYDLAKCRFDEAKILLANDKPDGAIYLLGYALELMLKRRIVHLLDWEGYPESDGDFKGKGSFRIHNLDLLLHFSGLEKKIKENNVLFARWQIARTWDSEVRYKVIGKISKEEVEGVLNATRDILNFISNTK